MKITKSSFMSSTAIVGLIAVLIESWFFLSYDGGLLSGIKIQLFVLVILLFLVLYKKTSLSSSTIYILIAIFVYVFLTILSARTKVPFGLGAFVMLSCIALMSDKDKLSVFRLFRWTVVIISAISCILYLLAYLNISIIPYRLCPFYEDDAPMSYRLYLGYIGMLDYGFQIRNCGIFNEPGLYGTVIALLLCADGINLRKPSNIILLLTGVTTLSVAFVVSLVAFIAIASIRKFRLVLFFLLFLFLLLSVVPFLNIQDNGILRLITRLTIDEGGLVGDDRTSYALDYLFSQVIHSDNCFFGLGSDYFETHTGYMSSSYKSWLIEYGIVGCIILWGTLIIASTKLAHNNLFAFFYIIVFFLNIYQRPQIYSLMYFVLLFGGILYIIDTHQSPHQAKSKELYMIHN